MGGRDGGGSGGGCGSWVRRFVVCLRGGTEEVVGCVGCHVGLGDLDPVKEDVEYDLGVRREEGK